MPINKLLLVTILILAATAILVFVREIPSRIAHGEQGRMAIYTLDEVRRPFLAIQAAEVMFLKNEYDEEVRTGLEREMENGNRLIAHYKDVAAYDAELLHRVELLASAYEEWLRAMSLMLAIPEQPDSRNVDVMHAADIVTASGFSDVMRLLGDTEDPVHNSIEEGSRAVTELLIIGGVLLAGVLFSIFFLMNSRNRLLGDMLAQQELAEKELQKSHDQLELGVVERTQALTEEIQERRTIESELLDRTELQQLLYKITAIANEANDTDAAMKTCLKEICDYATWPVGHIYAASPSDPDKLVPTDIWHMEDPEWFSVFHDITMKTEFKKGTGMVGRVMVSGKPEWIEDVTGNPEFIRAIPGVDIVVKAGFCFPIKVRNKIVAVMEFFTPFEHKVDQSLMQAIENIGMQLGRLHERKVAESILRESEERFNKSQSFAHIGSWDWDIQSGELHWSDQIAVMFGGVEGNVETSYENFLNAVHPDDRKMVTDAVNACVERNEDYDIEHRVVWEDGTVRWLRERGDVTRDKDGNPLHMLGVIRDVTDRHLAEEEVRLAKDEADRANKVKSTFLASMSHELRTPLNAIIGFSSMIREETFGPLGNDSYREYLNDIHHSGHHLLDLINDILDLSSVEANALELQEENVSLTDIVDASTHLIKPRADDGRVSVSVSIDPGIPPIYVDGRRLKQVLLNLLSNAVKFTPEGGEVSVSARLDDNGLLGLTVADTGVGMDEEEIKTALSRFGQVDSGLDRKHEGTGLGLPLTKGLMELHGGTLEIQSEKGHGTRITVTFPKERIVQNVC